MYFLVKLLQKYPFLKIPDAALKFWITLCKCKSSILPLVSCAEVFSTTSAQKFLIVCNRLLKSLKALNFMALILWIVINSLKIAEPLRQENLLLNANSPELPGSFLQGWKAVSTIKQSRHYDSGTHRLIQHHNHWVNAHNFNDSSRPLLAFSSRTNLKRHNICITLQLLK